MIPVLNNYRALSPIFIVLINMIILNIFIKKNKDSYPEQHLEMKLS